MSARSFHRTARQRAGGFVLAVTLWILAAIAVIAAMVSVWAVDGVRDAGTVQAEADQAVETYGTAQTLLYLLSTRDMTRAGLPTKAIDRADYSARILEDFGALDTDPVGGEIRMDGSPYQGLPDTGFSIQDTAGLLGVTWAVPDIADLVLATVPELRAEAPRLRDTLLDYVDEDDEVRPNGAEAVQYRNAGRDYGPANRMLTSPVELARVLGWERVPKDVLAKVESVISTYYLGPYNINTLPANVLAAIVPGCPALCETWVQMRQSGPFRNQYDLQGRLAISLPKALEDFYRNMPADTQRITVWTRDGRAWRWYVKLTPMADKEGPWTILAVYPVDVDPHDAQPTGSPLFAATPAGGR